MTTIGSLVQSRQVFAVQRNTTILEVVKYMAEKNIGAVAVLEGDRLVGIFSERDVITRVVSKQLDFQRIYVERVMTKDLIVADAGESEESCLRKMKAANCRHLPVVSGDKLIGLISLRDLLQVELTERDEKLEFLNSYLFHLPPDLEQRSKQ
jgi:CBS domain-containing protein